MHSYDDKKAELNNYVDYVKKSGIQYDSIFIDSDRANCLLEIIEKMYYDGYIKIKNKERIICDCGRVDMINIATNNAKVYSIKDGKMECNYCGKECHKYSEKTLVF